MAKKLRLAVAGLTDVGRRRERNQDNETHYVPDNETVLANTGALFVVCDGMGGHAAGEVAAELGVNTIRETYYSSEHPDIISRFAHSIKQANSSIYQYAQDHPEMAGMGTTCVGLVVNGGRGYFINIGDSRAYLLRQGQMRQVTQDHSWVAEQVRAGVLTEEQARTHSHRNVITRSLGTQPTVNADLFIEPLCDGDRVLLCSDGLHGYVDEAELAREMAEHSEPALGAQHMIDMANANGGPDNITALVVHMLEVPEVVGEVTLPTAGDGLDQTITQPLPTVTRSRLPAAPVRVRGGSQKRRAVTPDEAAAVAAAGKQPSSPRSGIVAAARLLTVAALLLVAVSIWYVGFGPYAQARAASQQLQSDLNVVQQATQQAPSQDPAQALAALASAQKRVQADLQDPNLDADSLARAQSTLRQQLVPAVLDTTRRYNAQAHVVAVPIVTALTYTPGCIDPNGASAVTLKNLIDLIAVPPAPPAPPPAATGTPSPTPAPAPTPVAPVQPTAQTLYALNGGVVYRLLVPLGANGAASSGTIECAALVIPDVSSTLALTHDGATLIALVQKSNGNFSVLTVTPDNVNTNGTLHVNATERAHISTPNGEKPTLVAVQGATTYVAYTGGTTGHNGLWNITGTPPTPPYPSVALTQPASALLATSNTLYLLLTDGSLGQLDSSGIYLPLPEQVRSPLAPDTSAGYSPSMPVPAPIGTQGTSAANSTDSTHFMRATLVADPVQHTSFFVADGINRRAIRLSASVPSPGIDRQQYTQFVYDASVTNPQLLALGSGSSSSTLNAFVWNGTQLLAFTFSTPAA